MDINKQIPYSIGKEQFYELLKPLSIRIIKRRINTIIYDRRKEYQENKNKSYTEIIRTKTIEQDEYKEYFQTYGYPDGFTKIL